MHYSANLGRLGALAIIAVSAAIAHADDLNPPTWRLQNASGTVQEWDFNTNSVPLIPDGNSWGSSGSGHINPFGTPLLTGTTTAAWLPNMGPRTGVYAFSGNQHINFLIPNHASQNHQKDVWIQLTYFAGGTTLQPKVHVASTAFSGPATFVTSQTLADGWTHATWSVHMPTQPSEERITLFNNTPVIMHLDQAVVDTLCTPVPEPASIAALGVGALGLLRRRKRSR